MRSSQPLPLRKDIGALWENFLFSERLQKLRYQQHHLNRYFWRTTTQLEIDYLEEQDGIISAFEFKWSPKRKAKFPKPFKDAYPDHTTQVIHRDNFHEFLLGESL